MKERKETDFTDVKSKSFSLLRTQRRAKDSSGCEK
jgi:hypothetical protein